MRTLNIRHLLRCIPVLKKLIIFHYNGSIDIVNYLVTYKLEDFHITNLSSFDYNWWKLIQRTLQILIKTWLIFMRLFFILNLQTEELICVFMLHGVIVIKHGKHGVIWACHKYLNEHSVIHLIPRDLFSSLMAGNHWDLKISGERRRSVTYICKCTLNIRDIILLWSVFDM